MRLSRFCLWCVFVLVSLLAGKVLADTYNDWPHWVDWQRQAKKTCNAQSNVGKDQTVFNQCMSEQILRDFPLPEGLSARCESSSGASAVDQAAARYKCLSGLVAQNALSKEKVALNINQNPEALMPLLQQCEQAYEASGEDFSKKWSQIDTCMRKLRR